MKRLKQTMLLLAGISLLAPMSTVRCHAETPGDSKMDWWLHDKFGLFIHWGPSSVAGVEIGWARRTHPYDHAGRPPWLPDAEYDALYQRFNPVEFDADAIVLAAKEAGMTYVVFTAKHHDGFSNWPTKLRDYNISNTPFQRDICKELADAVHKHGLKLGWYYSTRDWSHPDYLVGDNSKYNDFYHGQIRELLSNYGEVSVLWFDHVAGTWADYRFQELFDMIYELQPDILVNNRAARFVKSKNVAKLSPEMAALTRGDYDTPEGRIGVFRQDFPWETCMPMSQPPGGRGGWSYRPESVTKSLEECTQMLAACVTGCGNLLLNVGPMATGALRPEELDRLKQFKPWMETYGESIYGTEGGPYVGGQWGGSCMKGDTLYLHTFQWTDGTLTLPALPRTVLHCEELGGESVTCSQTGDMLILTLPDGKERSLHSVVKLTLEPGAELALIQVEGGAPKKQHGTLVNPMAK